MTTYVSNVSEVFVFKILSPTKCTCVPNLKIVMWFLSSVFPWSFYTIYTKSREQYHNVHSREVSPERTGWYNSTSRDGQYKSSVSTKWWNLKGKCLKSLLISTLIL